MNVDPLSFAAAVLQRVEGARREICLVSKSLHRRLYSSEALEEAVKRFVLSHERARLRIIVQQPRDAALSGHRLVELGRRVSSRIEFREPPAERIDECDRELLIVDQSTLIERVRLDAIELPPQQESAAEARRRRNWFQRLWDQSAPAQELRSLGL